MDVVSTCPLRVASMVWQPRPGAWALTVVCKATFQLLPGVCMLTDQQEEAAEDDVHWDDDAARSLHTPSDLVPFKAQAEVILTGHAFAPAGQAARALTARLVAGSVDKRIEVWCDRIFWQNGQLLEGRPFTRMSLRWERAAGGAANPVGMLFGAPPDAHGSVPIPNLQPPGSNVARRGDIFAPIGFGPIAPDWPERAGKLGRHAAGWSHRRWREQPLPGDLDRAYFNAAPPDQRLAAIEPDEHLLLENLHPQHPILETRLPGLEPRARFTSGGRGGEGVVLTADTLAIDTDRSLVTVLWRGRVPLTSTAETGTLVVALGGAQEGTVALGGEALPAAAMPFVQTSPAGELSTLAGARERGPALPFSPAKSPWEVFQPRPAERREAPEPVDTGTVYGVKGMAHGVLPMTWDAAQPARQEPVAELARGDAVPQAQDAVEQEPAAPAAPAAPAEAPPPPPPEIPIDRCAAIAASIARREADTAQILEENGLDAAGWAAVSRRWRETIRDATTHGKPELLQAYDHAYVARLEEERGPIGVEEYARLLVAAERGDVAGALAEMALPRTAWMRIERVWTRRIGEGDAGLGRAMRDAVKAARAG